MRISLGRHAIVAASLLLSAMVAPAEAADPPTSVTILVVDTQRVMGESKAGKAIQQQVQQRVQSYQQGLSKQEQALASAQQDLQKQQTILAQDAFSAKVKEFET